MRTTLPKGSCLVKIFKNLEFRLLIWLLKRYTREVDQFDHIKIDNDDNEWFIEFTLQPEYPGVYRRINL